MLDNQPLGSFTNQQVLDELTYRFFRQFSRTEYALKAVGHLKRQDGAAEADWKAFGDAIHLELQELFPHRDELREARDYLLSMPPKKQIAKGGNIQWNDIKPDAKTDTSLLLQYVCRVRNNLFHGGKFNGHWFDPERSEQLLRSSLTILSCCVMQSEQVLAAYTH